MTPDSELRNPNSALRVERRDLFRLVAAGLAGSAAAPWFETLAPPGSRPAAPGAAAPRRPPAGKPKNCILLWMIGGPPQTLTFDPKPHSAVKSIGTAASGVRVSEYLTKTAAVMRDVTLLRGMRTADSNHATARYLMHTGFRK